MNHIYDLIVLAPHIDDEIIGCFSLLKQYKKIKIVYFHDLDNIRKAEAKEVSVVTHWDISFNGYAEPIDENSLLAVPIKYDLHPHHRGVAKYAKKLKNKKVYYSVDKNIPCDLLSKDAREEKEAFLNKFYKSQDLWVYNKKYILFEKIFEKENSLLKLFRI